ncbi:MAG: heme A synthase [Clostridia bacterium]|nr:heme A synthase [Clostridia bacterium]
MALRRLSVVAVGAMYLVLVMGALVTNTGSGEGCGATWPLCHGRLLPLMDVHALVEWSHRAVTSIATVAVVALAALAWRHPGPKARNRWFAALAVAFLFGEAAIGAAAVVWPQPTALLATHFGISLLAYSGVFLLAVSAYAEGGRGRPGTGARDGDAPGAPEARAPSAAERALARAAWLLLAYTFAVIYSGAYVRHDGSFCAGWPLCPGPFVPAWGSPEFPQFVHRLLVALLLVALVATWRMARPFGRERPELPRAAAWALAFGVLQALSGLVVVRSGMSVPAAMLHAAIIPLLFSAELYLALALSLAGAGEDRRAGEVGERLAREGGPTARQVATP